MTAFVNLKRHFNYLRKRRTGVWVSRFEQKEYVNVVDFI